MKLTQLKKSYIPSKQIWDDEKSDEEEEYFRSDDDDDDDLSEIDEGELQELVDNNADNNNNNNNVNNNFQHSVSYV
jgi:hypothetical protein